MPPHPHLEIAWAAWCDLVKQQELDADDSRGHLVVHERLARFSPKHPETKEHVDTVLDVLYRGVPLLLAALGWAEPKAGSRGARNLQTDRARGDQWRLVMAYAGFETVARGLLGVPEKTYLEPADLRSLLAPCRLAPYEAIPTPEPKEAVREKWFQPELLAAPRHPLLSFLGVHNGDAEVIHDWLARGHSVDSWDTSLRLSQALRNVTAHGALSATKVREWKLREAIGRLTGDLEAVTASALRALVVPEVTADEAGEVVMEARG